MSTLRPTLGAIGVVLHEGQALLVQRAKAPDKGLWGYPGGHVELGETVAEAAARELQEETGLLVTPGPVLGTLDLIHRDPSGALQSHFFLVAVACHYQAGTARAADDAAAVAWVDYDQILREELPMSEYVAALLMKARAALG